MEDAKVERQHRQNERAKCGVEPGISGHRFSPLAAEPKNQKGEPLRQKLLS
jgi:hypothetical protein